VSAGGHGRPHPSAAHEVESVTQGHDDDGCDEEEKHHPPIRPPQSGQQSPSL